MLKKLASLLLSLLICLSLSPGQADAVDAPEGAPPVQTEALRAAQPDETENSVMPVFAGDLPKDEDTKHNGE